jgi:DNA-binding IclR family transcriptional regulator
MARRAGAVAAESGGEGSRSVRRALEMLELIMARGEPVPVLGLVEALAIPKSTAYELVKTLQGAGYLEKDPGGAWFLGRKLFELGMAYRSQRDLLKEGTHVVEALRDETGETVQLSVLDADYMVVLLKEEGTQPIRIVSRVGSRVPVNWAAAGRLLASDLDDKALRLLLARTVKPSPTGAAPTDLDILVKQIRRYRQDGVAVELNETNAHAGCVAAPVLDARGRVVAAISVVAPEQRLSKGSRVALIAAVKRAAATLSAALGGPG